MLVLSGCTGPGADDEPANTPETAATTASESTRPEQTTEETQESGAVLNQQGVNAGHPLAAEAGMEMLDAGGTAVDAAIAAAFAVSVVEPYASGVGGGGSALIATQDGEPEAFDYREVVAADGVIPPSNTGIPGFVAGMAELHARHGTLEWAQLLEPAIRMAEGGVPATEQLILRIAAGGAQAVAGQEQFAPGGTPLQVGQPLVQAELAQTFRMLQAEGPESFYTGTIADQLTQVNGIDPASLERYEIQHSEPPQGPVGDYQVVGSAPALPGVALIQMLQVLESQGIAELDPESAEYVQQISEAWVLAEETVRTHLGDPAFTDIPVGELVDPVRNAALVGGTPPAAPGGAVGPTDGSTGISPSTTHLTVVDSDGTVVSMTNTLTEFWGSGTEVGGFFLNDQLSRFTTFNTPQNQPEPGRRSVTWSNPAMVLDNEGRPVLGIGTPGGSNILSILGNSLTRWALMDQPLEEAVAAPRFRFNAGTQTFIAESAFVGTPAAQELRAQGWPVTASAEGLFGSLQTLEIDYDTGTLSGPTDTRLEAGTVITDVK
ncbi:gamma-glutamyltransferase [Corynebacterium halotolerans]|uniref:Capsule depolymerase CapD n=1 Tax=Corynebacterium halotolerans YIM 70093 = DSM 44683 TaxID=1121362 RepID=M1NQ57_9CORY|nr:gamma-glutamyltransferase [Corynebacterium halotolerans]AGF71637.1 capsule depolymerase CapD [Corynebacterium halotolerans YIM 70093 = DSM 44683]